MMEHCMHYKFESDIHLLDELCSAMAEKSGSLVIGSNPGAYTLQSWNLWGGDNSLV